MLQTCVRFKSPRWGGGIEAGVGGVVRSETGVILCSTCH